MLKAAIMIHVFIYLFIFPFASHLKAMITQWETLGDPTSVYTGHPLL